MTLCRRLSCDKLILLAQKQRSTMSPDALRFAGSERFSLRRLLGSGSFGVVYEAYDQKRSTRVALKVLKDASTLLQFKNEFRALADMQHPNLVQLHELTSHDDQWFFTMELVDGVNFCDYVSTPGERLSSSSADSPTVSLMYPVGAKLLGGGGTSLV